MTRKKKKAEEEQTITGLSPWRPLLDDIWKIDLDFPIGRVKAFLLLVLSPLGSFSVSLVHIRPWWRSDDSDAFFRTFSIFHFLKSEYFPKYHHFRHFVTFAGDFLDFLFLAIRRLSKTPAFPAPFSWRLSSSYDAMTMMTQISKPFWFFFLKIRTLLGASSFASFRHNSPYGHEKTCTVVDAGHSS